MPRFFKKIEKTIELCESPIEIELLLKIIDYVLVNSISSVSSDEEYYCYNLTFLYDCNLILERIGENNTSNIELRDPDKEVLESVFRGIRIDYSGYYEKEFTRYIEILPQKKFYYTEDDEVYGLPIVKKEFRLDFGVFLKNYKTDEVIKKFCIECDGYEYHSQQDRMIRDNERTRKLITEDYHTIRYLGKVINNMKSDGIKNLLDILFIEKNKEFDYTKDFINKGLKSYVDDRGIRWFKPYKEK